MLATPCQSVAKADQMAHAFASRNRSVKMLVRTPSALCPEPAPYLDILTQGVGLDTLGDHSSRLATHQALGREMGSTG
jgi:hypothetical protein